MRRPDEEEIKFSRQEQQQQKAQADPESSRGRLVRLSLKLRSPGDEAALAETLPAQLMRDGAAEGQGALPLTIHIRNYFSPEQMICYNIHVCLSWLGALPYILD